MAGVERVSVHVSRLAHCPAVFFVEFSRAGSVGNLVGLFVVCVADFTHDIPNAGEQARNADDCQDHSEAIPPICGQPFKNFVHVHQSIRAVGGVSCRI